MELLKNLGYKKLYILFLLVQTVFVQDVFAQCNEIEQIQPTIMVIPWTKRSEDVFDKIENDENYRSIISVIKDAFIQRDFSTEDFITEYENALKDNSISVARQSKDDVFKQLINNSNADIIIKAEIRIKQGNLGNYIGIELTAEDISSGENLSNLPEPEARSRQVRTSDYSKLASMALHEKGGLDRFLNDLNKSFSILKSKGRTISARIEVSKNLEIDLEEEIGENFDFFSDLIIDWVKNNAYKNNYHIQGNTASLLYFDVIKIPLRDSSCNNYTANNFEREFRKSIYNILRKINPSNLYKLTRVVSGNKIYFTIEKR